MEPAVTYRPGKEWRVFSDDHGPKVKLPALEFGDLLIKTLGRQNEVHVRQWGEHLTGDAFGTTADGADADAHATHVCQGLNPAGLRAKEDERFSLAQPADKFEWRPHAKSYTAGALAAHIVECIDFTAAIFGGDELDVDPKTYEPFSVSSPAELLEAFDGKVRAGVEAMRAASDSALAQPWRLRKS